MKKLTLTLELIMNDDQFNSEGTQAVLNAYNSGEVQADAAQQFKNEAESVTSKFTVEDV